jgi:hypothetical protein
LQNRGEKRAKTLNMQACPVEKSGNCRFIVLDDHFLGKMMNFQAVMKRELHEN